MLATRGRILTVTPANPAAGAEVSVVVPAGKRWTFLSATWQFVTSAVVASRNVRLQCKDAAGNIVYSLVCQGALQQTATQTFIYRWMSSPFTGYTNNTLAPNDLGTQVSLGFELGPGATLGTKTFGIDVGDQYSALVIYVEETDA